MITFVSLLTACRSAPEPIAMPERARAEVAAETLAYYAGSYELESPEPGTLKLEAGDGLLIATLDGQFAGLAFYPESATRFFAIEQPFEIEIAEDACGLTLFADGTQTHAERVVD
ncbi:hypothetical protein K1X12_10180 [Hyphomonas sp. WL0036]|uniref:hypothetical protein n=1 Tax=Hyphomonas sediminis TaxID=2866160 RepID=UPI001C823638|nr:hypothetical protein [Hyphomonas sediminis]MBY9067268.1 hypothetical protein [Hyphomonas sediminis]